MENTNIGDLFLLDLPPFVSKASQSQSFVSGHSQIPKSTSPLSRKQVSSSTRPTLVYSRKKATIIELVQVQESESTTSYEVNDAFSPTISPDFIYISDLNLPIAIRKGTRTCTQHLLYPLSHFMSYERLSSSYKNFLTSLNTMSIPKTSSEAPNGKEWKQVMRAEMEALEKNGTWDVVELPSEKSPMGYKWEFIVKYKVDSSLEIYKTRLIAKGYIQTHGVDY